MKYSFKGLFPWLVTALVTGAMPSCVDEDYDLSKDIDLNINIGGDLTVPSSSTDSYTMAQILDLDPGSSIKPDGALYGLSQGDYVLVQSGETNVSPFSIPRQAVRDIVSDKSSTEMPFTWGGAAASLAMPELHNSISLTEADIDSKLRSMSSAVTDIDLVLRISPSLSVGGTGSVELQPGFSFTFPEGWTVALTDAAAASYCRVEGNKVIFTAPRSINLGSRFDLDVTVTAIDFTLLPEGQGLYAPGKFKLDGSIVSQGDLRLTAGSLATGQSATLKFEVDPYIPMAEILQVTGSVDPDINVNESSIEINDIPDFLKEPGNNLDIENPRVCFTVDNDSPVDVNLNARIKSIDENGQEHFVWIGSQHGTDPIMIKGNAVTEICISRTGEGGKPGSVNVVVPELSSIIETIPTRIAIDNVEAKVPVGKEYTFVLGHDYVVDVDYEAVIPLAFGPELEFTYTTDEKGWDEDLNKYSFKKAVVTTTVENSVPLDMVPEVVALDRAGNPIDDVEVSVEGTVAGGTLSQPTHAKLVLTLTSKAANIGNLDGVRFTFRASCPDQLVGVALNESQKLRFTDIKIKILGGVGVDLN